MATCLKCFKTFHACLSCGLIGWEWDYCSNQCFTEAKVDLEKESYNVLSKISNENLNEIKSFLNDDTDDYKLQIFMQTFENFIKNIKEREEEKDL